VVISVEVLDLTHEIFYTVSRRNIITLQPLYVPVLSVNTIRDKKVIDL